jgi:hypothetical protein
MTRRTRHVGLFLKGPVLLAWLDAAAALRGGALAVGIELWFQAGLCGRQDNLPVNLSRLSIERTSAGRGLRALEGAGLVTVIREPGRRPTVTILPVAQEGRGPRELGHRWRRPHDDRRDRQDHDDERGEREKDLEHRSGRRPGMTTPCVDRPPVKTWAQVSSMAALKMTDASVVTAVMAKMSGPTVTASSKIREVGSRIRKVVGANIFKMVFTMVAGASPMTGASTTRGNGTDEPPLPPAPCGSTRLLELQP